MNLVKHEVSTLLAVPSQDMMVDTFAEAFDCLNNAKSIYQITKQYLEMGEGAWDSFDLWDDLEPFCTFFTENLEKYSRFMCSKSYMINKYTARVLSNEAGLVEAFEKATCASFCITDAELQIISNFAYKVASGMIFFLISEFNVFDMITDSGFSEDEVDEILALFTQRRVMQPVKLAEMLINDSKIYQLKFDIFDSFPEEEKKFLEIMGPDIVGVDETYLTMEMVASVIDGTLDPAELLSLMKGFVEEE